MQCILGSQKVNPKIREEMEYFGDAACEPQIRKGAGTVSADVEEGVVRGILDLDLKAQCHDGQ